MVAVGSVLRAGIDPGFALAACRSAEHPYRTGTEVKEDLGGHPLQGLAPFHARIINVAEGTTF